MSADKTAGQPTKRRILRRAEPEKDTKNLLVSADRQHDGALTAKKDRPTPSRRKEEEAEEESGNVVTRTGSGLADYLQGVRSEFAKVAWPTREDARRLTIIVLIALIASAVALGLIALIFTELFRIGLDSPIILFGFMFIAVAAGYFINRRTSNKSSAL